MQLGVARPATSAQLPCIAIQPRRHGTSSTGAAATACTCTRRPSLPWSGPRPLSSGGVMSRSMRLGVNAKLYAALAIAGLPAKGWGGDGRDAGMV